MNSLVTVVIPSYNHERYVAAAVDSCLSQTYTNLEVIVVDDGSRDHSVELLRERYSNDSRVRIFTQENTGAHSAINEGIRLATGDYIAILNSDDVFHHRRIETLIQEAGQANHSDSLVFSDLEFIDGEGCPISEHERAHEYKTLQQRCHRTPSEHLFFTGNLAMTSSNFFCSKALYESVGEFAALRYTHDWDWALRATAQRRPIWVRENLLRYRVHSSNTISESDVWCHIRENGFVHAKAIWLLVQRRTATDNPRETGRDAYTALLHNKSFLPLPTLYCLVQRMAGVTETELLELAASNEAEWDLRRLAEASGLPTTGAGLRAWGLGKGLESQGFKVSYLMPEGSLMKVDSARRDQVRAIQGLSLFTFENINQVIREVCPDVLVVQHWPTVYSIDTTHIPTALDLHGPILLETMFQGNPDYESLKGMKIEAFHKCDFFTCPAERQRYYFYPWMMLGGCDLRTVRIEAIPISLSPEIPSFTKPRETTFVYGGVLLPWHDPAIGLEALVETLEKHGSGTLNVYCGKHPYINIPSGVLEQLLKRLRSSPRVSLPGMLPRDRIIEAYRQASVAFDAMARNPERELAFTTRTVEYMWCGLPVVYQDYSVLASYIEQYDAGWLVDPENADQIRQVIEHILHHPEEIREKGTNAQRLVRQAFTWDRTIGPLAGFCEKPFKLEKAPSLIGRLRGEIEPIREQTSRFKHDVHQVLYYLSQGSVKEVIRGVRRRIKKSLR